MNKKYGLVVALLLAGCAGTGSEYEPVVDGPKDARYRADLSQCQELSRQHSYTGPETQNKAAIGAGIGAAASGVISGGNPGSMVEGAVLGGIGGAGSGAVDASRKRQEMISQCMRGRGHRVVD